MFIPLLGIFSFLPLASVLHAEILQLKNGNAIETKILKETEDFVVVEAPGGKVKIPKREYSSGEPRTGPKDPRTFLKNMNRNRRKKKTPGRPISAAS